MDQHHPSQGSERQCQRPVDPGYPLNGPGAAIVLHDGMIGGLGNEETNGLIQLRCGPRIELAWEIDSSDLGSRWLDISDDPVELTVHRADGVHPVLGQMSGLTSGWLNPVDIQTSDVGLTRVVVHWINLPEMLARTWLAEASNEGGVTRWPGRCSTTVGGWQLTLDRRRDYKDVWTALRETDHFAITHVMEIRRVDDALFSVEDVNPVLQALHFGLSFALGRWVAPALPVGFETSGRRVWERWGPPLCDPVSRGSAWWFHYRDHDLQQFLPGLVAAFCDPDRRDSTRFLMSMAVHTNAIGFIEPRIMTGFAALEHLSWVTLVLGGHMSKTKHKHTHAEVRLRQLLDLATIPAAVDPADLPTLARFAADKGSTTSALDGPAAVTYLRRGLVHPTRPHNEVYHLDGLVIELWYLVRHYVTLLILHSLGYAGSYQKLLRPGGWAGEVELVPWAGQRLTTDAPLIT